jgi:hypothetical protein
MDGWEQHRNHRKEIDDIYINGQGAFIPILLRTDLKLCFTPIHGTGIKLLPAAEAAHEKTQRHH